MKPDTRARTSTVATATNRPVYSSHSVIVFCIGFETVTGGGGGAAPAPGLLSQPASRPANNAATIKRRSADHGAIFHDRELIPQEANRPVLDAFFAGIGNRRGCPVMSWACLVMASRRMDNAFTESPPRRMD